MATQTDRVLIEIVTAANTTGIKEAQAGFLNMHSALTGALAGMGLLAVAGKSAVDIAEKREKAEADLAQALKTQKASQKDATSFLDGFISSNRAYISDQSEVIDGYAALTRSGLSQTEVQLDMNRAVDLAAIKHISLTEAVDLVNKAEHGRARGLVDLGITSAKYVDSSGNVIDANHNMALVMYELDQKTAHGRETTTQMSQATNKLSNDWQNISLIAGPPLLGLIEGIAGAADWLIQGLDWIGHNQDWNNALSAGFGNAQLVAYALRQTFDAVVADIQWVLDNAGKAANFAFGTSSTGSPANLAHKRAASGFDGTVSSPTLFLAGEAGVAEDVHITPMGSGGRQGPASIHIHVDRGAFIDGPSVDRLANVIAQRLTYVTGR